LFPYLPFPYFAHGGAVRIHNLMARAAADWDQILVAVTDTDAPLAAELLERFLEVARSCWWCGPGCGTPGCTSLPARGTSTSSTTTVPR